MNLSLATLTGVAGFASSLGMTVTDIAMLEDAFLDGYGTGENDRERPSPRMLCRE